MFSSFFLQFLSAPCCTWSTKLTHCAHFCTVEGVTVYISDFKRSLADKLSKNFFSEPSQVTAKSPLLPWPNRGLNIVLVHSAVNVCIS